MFTSYDGFSLLFTTSLLLEGTARIPDWQAVSSQAAKPPNSSKFEPRVRTQRLRGGGLDQGSTTLV